MPERKVYLDTSAIVKRYVIERDSERIDMVYTEAETKDCELYFSFWNIGETIGIFDRKRYREVEKPLERAKLFLDETSRLVSSGSLTVIDVTETLRNAIPLVLRYHIYIADALQLASASYYNANEFITADKALAKVAKQEGLRVVELEN